MSLFKPAQRAQAKMRLALAGPSGSGKTYSALLIARGLVGPEGKIAVIDTERGSASLYAHLTPFDVAELEPPFTPDKYIQAIRDAERAGYSAVVIDSLSHAWAGPGGILDLHDAAAAKEKSSFAAWRHVTPKHNELVDAMLQAKAHVIATMRSKQEYAQVEEGSRKKVVKLGLAPVQRDGMEYEFTVFLDLDASHNAVASKDRTSLFDGLVFRPSEETGRKLAEWLSGAAPASVAPAPAAAAETPAATPAKAPAENPAEAPEPEKPVPAPFAGQVKIFGEPRKYRSAFAVQALLGDELLVLLGDVSHLRDGQVAYVEGDRVNDRVGVKTLTVIEITEPTEAPAPEPAPAKSADAKAAPFKGRVTILGTPVEGARGLEVQALAGEENVVLVGKIVAVLTEGDVVYVEGRRAGDRVSVFLAKPDTIDFGDAPGPCSQNEDDDLLAVTITAAPKKAMKTLENGAIKEFWWARGAINGRNVLVVGNDATNEAVRALAPGQTVRVRGELVRNEKGQDFLNAQEILTA